MCNVHIIHVHANLWNGVRKLGHGDQSGLLEGMNYSRCGLLERTDCMRVKSAFEVGEIGVKHVPSRKDLYTQAQLPRTKSGTNCGKNVFLCKHHEKYSHIMHKHGPKKHFAQN